MKNTPRLILGFGIIVLTLLTPRIGNANPDAVDTLLFTDDILRSRMAFAVVEEEILHHLNLASLSETDYQKLHGPVLWKIRAPIHFQLREQFGSIVNAVDFDTPGQSPSISPSDKPFLHKKASEIIQDFITQKHISVIIRSNAPIGIGETATIRRLQANVRYTYDFINGACVVVPIKNLAALIRRQFVVEIWPDAKMNLSLNTSIPQIGADAVHNARPSGLGVTGEGVVVAVVDGGIDGNHSALKGRVVDTRGVLGGGGSNKNKDEVDHGTHVAGIIGANGKRVTGVAPKVELLDAQVDLNNDSPFFRSFGDSSDVMDAIRWAASKHRVLNARPKADIINMSLGAMPWRYTPDGRTGKDPLSKLVDAVVSDGIVFVVSAGNEAKKRSTGSILSDPNPIRYSTTTHEFRVKHIVSNGGVIPGVKITVTLLWDTKANDLDLTLLDFKNRIISSSATSGDYYEKIEFTSKVGNPQPYKLRVGAAFNQVQTRQKYEVWVDSDYAAFDFPNSAQTVGVPGYSEKVITVGAIDSSNSVTWFSSQGPSHTGLIKPEIVAPGKNIESTISAGGHDQYPGTSMAAPHVAGVAALILDAVGKNDRGEWNFSPDEVKSAIVRGAEGLTNVPDNTYGAGLVRADQVIFGGTVRPKEKLRFEINPRLTSLSYGGYVLNADPSVKVAISWQNPDHNLDLVLSDATNGRKILEANQNSSNYEKISPPPNSAPSYYLDVINRSQVVVAFTGASTHPIDSNPSTYPILTSEAQTPLQPQDIPYSVLATDQTNSVLSTAFSPRHSGRLATARSDGTIHVWDTSTHTRLYILDDHTDSILSIAFSPDGRTLASAGIDNTVRLWDTSTGDLQHTLTKHTDFVTSLAFSADGGVLASGSKDGTIRLWNPNTGQQQNALTGYLVPVLSLAFSPIGSTLATGRADNIIRLWDLSTGRLLHTLRGHTDFVLSLAFNPNGSTLASGSADSTVRLWNTSTGTLLKTLTAHTDWVNSVAFSSTTLASGSFDKTLCLWDADTGDLQHTLTVHTNSVESLAFSTDGSTLASGSADGKVVLWAVTLAQVIADVNGDGVVNILDLILVDAHFGATGQHTADINGDGVVDIADLVLVANALGAAAAAPSARNSATVLLTAEQVQQWLTEARLSGEVSVAHQRGILVLEQLLAMLMPKNTALLPNYPNPFNPETWIPYQLAEPADVTVTLYAANGTVVRTLEVGHQPAGIYQSRSRAVYWDGKNTHGEAVASGLYFYTLTAGDFTATQKMLIRK